MTIAAGFGVMEKSARFSRKFVLKVTSLFQFLFGVKYHRTVSFGLGLNILIFQIVKAY